jgi:hypothetical protein
MKAIALCILGLVLAGCEYTVPLAAKPELKLDRALLGVWERQLPDGKKERLLVLPLDENEYLVSFPAGTPDAMFARACLVKVGEETLVQLRWFGNAHGNLITDEPPYQYVAYSATEGTLSVQLLNSDVIPKDIPTTEALAQAIVANIDHPDLFREPMMFQQVKE